MLAPFLGLWADEGQSRVVAESLRSRYERAQNGTCDNDGDPGKTTSFVDIQASRPGPAVHMRRSR
jgi:hypothetical protein